MNQLNFASVSPSLAFWCFLFFAISASSFPALAKEVAEKPKAPQDEPTTLIFIGTHPGVASSLTEYTPGHLRAVLNKIKPQVLAVETPANLPQAASPSASGSPNEIRIIRPWCEEHSVAMEAIGYLDGDLPQRTAQLIQKIQMDGLVSRHQSIEQEFQQQLRELPPSFESLNSDGYQQVWRRYHQSMHELATGETPWELWNQQILTNLKKVCQKNPGKRIAVVIGAAHLYYLHDRLKDDSAIRIERVDPFLPLTGEEVTAATTTPDLLLALAPLNLNELPAQELNRLEPFLNQLQNAADARGDFHLLKGKYLLHTRKPAEALKEFDALGELGRETKSLVDGQSSLFETGLVYTGLALFQSGDVAKARQRLEKVVADTSLSSPTRQWAELVLKQISLTPTPTTPSIPKQ